MTWPNRVTWRDRAIAILCEQATPIDRVQFAALSGLSVHRSSFLLGQLAMYGQIERVRRYKFNPHRPSASLPALYRARA